MRHARPGVAADWTRASRLWSAVRRRSRRVPGALILRYHRVADPGGDPFGIVVSPGRFAEHLEVLRRCYLPVRLGALVDGLAGGGLPPRAVAITFDDGYADVLSTARPLLERHDIPATLYLVSGALDRDREFWWDELQRILLEPGTLPDRLEAGVGGGGAAAGFDRSATSTPQRGDAAGSGDSPPAGGAGRRREVFRLLFERVRRLDEPEREKVMAELVRWSGAARAPRHSHRLLRADEVARLDRDSLLEVGAHTVSHPMLSRLGAARRHAEIAGSKRRLEELLGRPVASFAYPYGAGVGTARMVRRAGFESACTTAGRRVVPGSDRYRLPRVYVGDWDGDQLERRLAAVG